MHRWTGFFLLLSKYLCFQIMDYVFSFSNAVVINCSIFQTYWWEQISMGSNFRWGNSVDKGVKFPRDLSSNGSLIRGSIFRGHSSSGSSTLEPSDWTPFGDWNPNFWYQKTRYDPGSRLKCWYLLYQQYMGWSSIRQVIFITHISVKNWHNWEKL